MHARKRLTSCRSCPSCVADVRHGLLCTSVCAAAASPYLPRHIITKTSSQKRSSKSQPIQDFGSQAYVPEISRYMNASSREPCTEPIGGVAGRACAGVLIMISAQDPMNSNIGESQAPLRFWS
jgi:hypothetical protein